jgi:Secretion system C-terminal sorting domain
MRYSNSIMILFICLMIILNSNESKASTIDYPTFNDLLTDTTDMDQSTIWYTSSYTGGMTADRDCELQIDFTKVVRDTVIGDRLARVIGLYRGGTYMPESEIVLFSKSGKMYFYEDDTWKLLYDFTAKVGDTITYYISKTYPYHSMHNISYEQYIMDQNPYQLVIEKIDTIFSLSGKPLKRFSTKNAFEIYSHKMRIIIENAGSVAKLFGNNGIIVPPECLYNFPTFRCYSDDDVSINFVDGECDKLVSVTDINLTGITIYPNPGMTHLIIKKNNEQDFLFTITNVAGQILTSGQVDIQLEISTVDWTSGLYFINITDSQGNRSVQKWIKI